MEFLRRLRTVWTVFCALCALLVVIAHTGNPTHIPLALVVPCIIVAAVMYADGGWRKKLTAVWFGGPVLAVMILVHADTRGSTDGPRLVFGLIATWAVVATIMWLIDGLRRPKQTQQ